MNLLSELLALNEEQETIDVRDCEEGKQIPHKYWPKGVMYKGVNVFDTIYESDVVADAEKRISENFDGSPDRYGKMTSEFIDIDWLQECYLGYDKKRDIFILGFDGNYSEDNPDYDEDDEDSTEEEVIEGPCSPYVVIKVEVTDGKAECKIKKSDCVFSDSWYSAKGGYKAVAKVDKLVDIRLD